MRDYHIHTPLCGHAEGAMEDYVEQALTQSLQEIGFADHLPMLKWANPEYAMSLEMLPVYLENVRRVQREYPNVTIKFGIEADYYTSAEEQATQELLAQYPFDYVYGSIHFLDDWAIDDPRNLPRWNAQDVDLIYARYFALLHQAAASGVFDILAHFDLPKKFGHAPTKDFSNIIQRTVVCCKEHGVAIEINTAGLRKPINELYPSRQIMQWLKQYDVPIVLGSDAHRPEEVGKDFEYAKTVLHEVGYTQVAIFKQRKIVEMANL